LLGVENVTSKKNVIIYSAIYFSLIIASSHLQYDVSMLSCKVLA